MVLCTLFMHINVIEEDSSDMNGILFRAKRICDCLS